MWWKDVILNASAGLNAALLCFGKHVPREEVGDLQPCQPHVEHGAFALQGHEDGKKHGLCHEKAEDLQICFWQRFRQTLFVVQLHI